MKKNYQKPTMNVVKMEYQSIICQSYANGVSSNLTGDDAIGYGGGGNGGARSRGFGDWDDDGE